MRPFVIAHSSKNMHRKYLNLCNEWLYLTSLFLVRQLRSLKDLPGSLVVHAGNAIDDNTIRMAAG